MKSFLLNLGHLLGLIFMTAAIMFGVRSFLQHNEPLSVRLGTAALQGAVMGSLLYYRAKPRA